MRAAALALVAVGACGTLSPGARAMLDVGGVTELGDYGTSSAAFGPYARFLFPVSDKVRFGATVEQLWYTDGRMAQYFGVMWRVELGARTGPGGLSFDATLGGRHYPDANLKGSGLIQGGLGYALPLNDALRWNTGLHVGLGLSLPVFDGDPDGYPPGVTAGAETGLAVLF